VTRDVDLVRPATDGSVKYMWTVEHSQLIYGDVLFDAVMSP